MWTERDHACWDRLMDWEQQLVSYEGNDLEYQAANVLERLIQEIPEEVRDRTFAWVDQTLFNVHSLLQGSQQKEARERILASARIIREDIEHIQDLRKLTIDQLRYISRQQMTRNRFYSAVQGAITGTGAALPVAADFLGMTAVNLRAVQLTALSYGYDVEIPFEMTASLNVFHAAMLPDRLKAEGWAQVISDIEDGKEPFYFYEGKERMANETWLEEQIRQSMKIAAVMALRNKKVFNISLLSVAIGAGVNYRLTKKVTEFAESYYQYRYLNEKKERTGK
ncbi:EcsC family protein [Domibacillus epiphyticus]|uniref:ABC transporter substrate-binding protein n=1 Tax=Domibacillus epiphyticus TaxID=1714355 RepID=A0A1V2A9B8_9BACI|nr:EcsC family protein [Domibacillus epiphyticus]OMP67452.1 ABC transporter substrate-binding protein [Domibacillus epiphyticus]